MCTYIYIYIYIYAHTYVYIHRKSPCQAGHMLRVPFTGDQQTDNAAKHSEGGMIRLETLIELILFNSSFSSLSSY